MAAQLFGTLSQGQIPASVTLQDKTVKSNASANQSVQADSGYDGIGTVTVEKITLQDKSVTPTSVAQTVTADEGYDGLGEVTVGAGGSGPYDDLPLFCSEQKNAPYQNFTITAAAGYDVYRGFGNGWHKLTLSGYKQVGSAAFYYDQNLFDVVLPDVEIIASNAFYNAVLYTVDIGEHITTIQSGAFKKCTNLTDIYIRANSVPTLATADSLPTGATAHLNAIHVPAELIASYEADAVWGTFTGKFVALAA